MIRTLLFLAALFVAYPAFAQCPTGNACFTNCQATPSEIPPPTITKSTDIACYEFNQNATVDDDSFGFRVSGDAALVCLDPDTASKGPQTATVNVRRCNRGQKPTINPENECILIVDLPLDGTVGGPGNQNSCVRVSSGLYYIDIATPPGANENAVVSLTGEGVN